MKSLVRLVLILAAFFATTFILGKSLGLFSVDQVKVWFESLKSQSPVLIFSLSAGLLFLDLFIAVPTLTICILSGYFLGYQLGFASSLLGTTLAGVVGYIISRFVGERILSFLVRDPRERNHLSDAFHDNSVIMILLSRALPILPEVSAVMSGMTGLSFRKFLLLWHASSIPYVLIATYFGSISTTNNPKPAIFAAIGITSFLWFSWYFISKRNKKLKGIP
jgi:uncharacterized membrane protein YdjX (TVP38/TMEM64 family)